MYVLFVTTIMLLTNFVSAQTNCEVKDIKSFYKQIRFQGPIAKATVERKKQVNAGLDIAKQRPNPELDFEYLRGDQFGLDVNTYTVSAKHIIELGGKVESRVKNAQKSVELNNSSLDIELHKISIESTISFQRIAQLDIKISATKEAIQTFQKVVNKLSSRKRLNPEETVSLSTINLALNDYRAKLNDFQNERDLLQGKISYLAGCSGISPKYTNLKYKVFDKVEANRKSGLLKLEDLKVELAESKLGIEKSSGYSNLSIGPVIEYQNQGEDEFVSGGIALTFALPLFQTNDGGKREASRGLVAQKIESENNKNLLTIKRTKLIMKFNRSLKTLNIMPSLKQVEREHAKTEKLFSRGVVSISMTIESHRQLIDFLTSRFETENDLLDTYGKITLIDGDLNSFDSLF